MAGARRPMQPDIYGEVANYARNQGGVRFIAHAVFDDGTVQKIGPEVNGGTRAASGHPDQVFWDQRGVTDVMSGAVRRGSLKRIEIDCDLMPCHACLVAVPAKIQSFLPTGSSVDLRFFSHRLEHVAPAEGSADRDVWAQAPQAGKAFFCKSNDTAAQLERAEGARIDWMWTPYNGRYVGPAVTIGVGRGSRTFAGE